MILKSKVKAHNTQAEDSQCDNVIMSKRKGIDMTKVTKATFPSSGNKSSCNKVYLLLTSGKYLAILLSGEGNKLSV